MSNVVDFLEKMGRDAQLRHASSSDVELALTNTQIDSELPAAILAKDQLQLEVLLGCVNVCCMLEPSKEDEGEDDDAEKDPSRDEEEELAHSVCRVVASAG